MMSSNLKLKLRNCFKNSLPQCNIKKIIKSKNYLSSLFCFKGVIPEEFRLIVYNFLCRSFSFTYYGKTERHFNVRSSEYIGISYVTGKRVECKQSAVSNHLLMYNHDSNFNDFTILY